MIASLAFASCVADVDESVAEAPVAAAPVTPKITTTPKPAAPAPKPAPASLEDDSIADLLKGLDD